MDKPKMPGFWHDDFGNEVFNGDEIRAHHAAWEAYVAQVEAERDALRADAERYRWLLRQAWFQEAIDRFDIQDDGLQYKFEAECRRIIDAAREGEHREG